jgi:CRISPR-associated helicase Cas3
MDLLTINVDKVTVEGSNENYLGFNLRKFQNEVKDSIEKREKVVLQTPTGSGKTFSLLLSKHSVGLYPVLELLEDQYRSVSSLFKEVEYSDEFIKIVKIREGKGEEKLALIKFSASLVRGKEINLDVLQDVDRKIVFTTPDSFHIYNQMLTYPSHTALAVIYGNPEVDELLNVDITRSEIRKRLSVFLNLFKGEMVFADEFHLYDNYQLSSLIITLKIIKRIHDHDFSLILSSATPSEEKIRKIEEGLKAEFGDNFRFKRITARRGEVLVRGRAKVRLIFVESKGKTKLSRFVNAGDEIPDLIHEGLLDEVYKELKEKKQRGIIVVDKVSQALEIAKAIYERFNTRVVCKTSIKGEYCGEDDTFVVGSSAITQGVDYPNVSYGLIARFFSEATIQAVGRIGRKMEECRIDLVLPKVNVEKREMSYEEFVDWIMKTYPSIKEIYYGDQSFREFLLLNSAIAVYERLTGHKMKRESWSKEIPYVGDISSLSLIYYFRFTGPQVSYTLGSTEGVVDLGTIMRNFSFEVKEGKFLLKGVGRSSIVAECDQKKLEGLVNKIVSSTFLELLGCKFEDENGNSVSLGKQLFLIIKDERLSDFIISTARGIGVKNSDRYCLAFI